MPMRAILRSLFRRLRRFRRQRSIYTALVEVMISREAILHNLRTYQNLTQIAVAPVLKSNAYGHGLVEVATLIEREHPGSQNLPFFVVDSYHEALVLRNEGIETPILIIGFTAIENMLSDQLNDIIFTLGDMEQIRKAAERVHKPTRIHLKFDTGMHRQGILPRELDEALRIIASSPLLKLEGVCSHLADSHSLDENFTKKQIALWNEMSEKSLGVFPDIKWRHLSASNGVLYHDRISANLMRLGIGLYGVCTDERTAKKLSLKPALSMRTSIVSVKKIDAGESVGYDRTFIADREMTLATLPAGYYEGVDIKLATKGSVRIQDDAGRMIVCPIVGRVTMNITIIDISAIPKDLQKIGATVEIISGEESAPNSIQNIARLTGAIPYELLVHIPRHLRRVVSQ